MQRIVIHDKKHGVEILIQFPDRQYWAWSYGGALNLLDFLQGSGWITQREWDICFNALEKAA